MSSVVTLMPDFHKAIADIESLKSTGNKLKKDFIEIISYALLQVLRENTPKQSGELANSWKVFERGLDYVVVGTELVDKFKMVVNGVRPQVITAKNGKAMHFIIGGEEFFRVTVRNPGFMAVDFITPIVHAMDKMIQVLILSLIKRHWKVFKRIKVKEITKFNLSKTVGLTGTKRNARRGRGGGIQKAKTGRKSFKRTLSRRRRTGKFLTSKKAKVG